MSKNVAVFVDVANLYYSARGQDVDVDYVALLKAAAKGRDLIRAYAYSGLDPENENQRKFIDFLGKNGYKVVHKDIRKFGDGRIKANLDIELVVDLFRLADRMDIAVIVSGDGDFAPAIRALQDKGVRCEVISFRPNTSGDLIAVADEFIDIMKIASIGREKGEKGEKEGRRRGMSAPEMPAKEVTPEFGFREASPQVVAAALAAIKGGGTAGRGNGRAAPAPGEAARPGERGERRRRRRGGRGRGRGRRAAEEAATGEAERVPAEEAGLEELEGLPEMGDVDEEREYSFEEADEATLRELGVSPAEAASDVADAKPARSRRRTAETKGRQPHGRRAKPKEGGDSTTERKTGATRSRRQGGRTTKAAAAKPAAEASEPAGEDEPEQPQGIWQRFRSAR